MGKSALEGLDGVKSVTSGFSGFREINTVVFDPRVIDREHMVSVLKAADTYIGTKE